MITPLDVAVVLILVAFLALGAWRGLIREVMTTVGILLAASLVNEWAAVWGAGLTQRIGLVQPLATFLVAMGVFAAVVLVIGYGSAVLLPESHRPTRWQRAGGTLLGLVNGTLILGYVLRIIQHFLLADAPDSLIVQSVGGTVLITLVSLVFLLPVLVLAPVIVVTGVVRLIRRRRTPAVTLPAPVEPRETTTPLRPEAPEQTTQPFERPPAHDRVDADATTLLPRPTALATRTCPHCGQTTSATEPRCQHCSEIVS